MEHVRDKSASSESHDGDEHEGAEHTHGDIQAGRVAATIISGVGVAIGLLCHWLKTPEWSQRLAFGAAVVAGGWHVAPQALRAAMRFSPDMSLLMSIAAIGALFINAWDEAASVVFLYSVAELLESYSVNRARHAVRALMDLAPETALVRREQAFVEVPVAEVGVGNMIQIKPGSRIALDGVVERGESSVNQAPITGESIPVAKTRGCTVFAGSINELGSLEVRVTKRATESTLANIVRLVEEAQKRKAPTQRFVDVFTRIYTPAVIVLATFIAIMPPLMMGELWSVWGYRALVMLVIACPCAVVISTPVTVVSGLTAAARIGVLIKGGSVLEELGKLKALAVDKTGTITEGRPRVVTLVPLNNTAPEKVLAVAASLEQLSEHPLARAILEYAGTQGVRGAPVDKFRAIIGRGAEGIIDGHFYFLGNHRLVEEMAVCSKATEARIAEIEVQGQTAVVVGHRPHADCKGEVMGILAIGDTMRSQIPIAISRLREAGIEFIFMLTGDNKATADVIAKLAGIDFVSAELLPEDKVRRIEELKDQRGHVGMVGDGVNDAPALAVASVGIAMGVTGTDAALETADVTLMADDLNRLSDVIILGRKTAAIIRFNIAFSILIKMAFLGLAAMGKATMWMAVAADMGASLFVIANGLRLLGTGKPASK